MNDIIHDINDTKFQSFGDTEYNSMKKQFVVWAAIIGVCYWY